MGVEQEHLIGEIARLEVPSRRLAHLLAVGH
jgi:hypothetical protein